ncbi:hypothetical protein [Lysinibacter cavernae]|uniref:Flagellar motor component MotA n=1 Tax=Lysinibacter cavernae TaxID=1640652 RepID=A0A7X5TTN8_9MICO|nr:hypothetical protein [Lysinibacter cavernae]NIH54400.1 flagellar motor component MotA [Lysinibacter cavernae]
MTDAQPMLPAPRPPSRVLLPGIAVGFFIISPFLLLLGYMIFMGTSSRGFFEGAPTQVIIGGVVFAAGFAALMIAFALEGVRSIAQQHLEAVREIEHAKGDNG